MRGTVARIDAESVCLLSGAGLLVRLENFRCLYAAITANPPPPRAFTAGAFGFLTLTAFFIWKLISPDHELAELPHPAF